MRPRAKLVESRMSNAALYQRVQTLLQAVQVNGYDTIRERNELLSEARRCVRELEMRGTQLSLLTEE